MRRFSLLIMALAAATAPVVAQAKKPKMSPLEIQQMQSRDLEASKNIAFSAVMSVLQDEGYRVGSADKDTGLITAIASTSSKLTWMPFVGFGKSKKTPVVSAFIEEVGANITKVRLNFVMGKASSNQYGSNADEEPILDPLTYQDAFEKIQKAVFIKQAVATAPAAVEAAVITPAAPAAPATATPAILASSTPTQPASAPATTAAAPTTPKP